VDCSAQTDSQFIFCCKIRNGIEFEAYLIRERAKNLSELITVLFINVFYDQILAQGLLFSFFKFNIKETCRFYNFKRF
jgi:hypothetical protein